MHMDYCLDKARRLTHNNEYRLVYKHGKYEVGRMCVLYRMPVAKQPTRIGFVTGKKVGCAVERNRARRLMKEVYRLNQHAIREGYHIVIVGRGPLKNATYEKEEKEILYLLRKSKLLIQNDKYDHKLEALVLFVYMEVSMKRCITTLLRLLIRFYQLAISPLKPGCCRYYPTCSTYTLQAIEKYGPLKGSWMGLKRILRCHPFHKGGYDPVP